MKAALPTSTRFPDVPAAVRRRMSRVRKSDTKPEMIVRQLVHGLGYRFRLHRQDLPGTPDLTFPSRRKVIFVHGCFWHRHNCRLGGRLPTTRPEYWLPKLSRNVDRDRSVEIELLSLGWRVLVIWECETRSLDVIRDRLLNYLDHNTELDSQCNLVQGGARRCDSG
ncbi:very short patch repair endonuclease [Mesorhizobium sp. B292B1B]|uniref:very short patch repair endonuclease n=1 Tax=unclassified Mesorhizobium TaxID=325217 RepID=UPI001127B230|nr:MULTISPECIES: very short patch repair endonuclease [unclassified Mesorhizobium]MCA0015568.1 very short patch repair endonuclease [Mesorhizobium sp. B294B1A1]MCA0041366.1 very short patch repair endonuclease [Mesorhizobium sp. B292B1B]TPM48144.1 DNA mismatch endonuclease Vsr [Mesorhizobium sp. B2-3-2]